MQHMKFIKPTLGDKIYRVVALTLLALIILVIIYPLWFVVVASFSTPTMIYETQFLLWFRGFTLDSYKMVLDNKEIFDGYASSALYTILGTTINIVMTILCAYPLSRKDFYGKGVLTIIYLITMYFSGGLIPSFLINRMLGLYDNLAVMVLPMAISVYNMIIMRTYFVSRIPDDLTEAAQIDGCSNIKLLVKVVLPLSAPILAVLGLYYGVGHWNSYLHALIYINDRSKFPLQLVLREILIKNEMNSMTSIVTDDQYSARIMASLGLKYVVIVVSTLPIFVIYPLMQRFFKEGVLVGALKG